MNLNQQTEIEISDQNDNASYSEITILEHLNSKVIQNLNNLICDSNSSLYFLSKENIDSLRKNEIYIEKEENTLTNESIKNLFSEEKLLKPKEKEVYKNELTRNDSKVVNNELNTIEEIISDNNKPKNKNISKKRLIINLPQKNIKTEEKNQ